MRSSLNKRRPAAERARRALHDFLRRRALRLTGEREALLAAAIERESHFTLAELARDVMRRDASASRATVFRSLPLLVEAGILQPALVSGEARRYELALGRRHHDHLRCSGCGRIEEFRSPAIEEQQLKVAARHGFHLDSHVHELVGECGECRRRKSAQQPPRRAAAKRRGPAGKHR